jgi:diketogulonate reductase-like aldo/keto reductase
VCSLDAASLAWVGEVGIPNLVWSSQTGGYFVGIHKGTQFDGAENVRRRAVLDRVSAAAGVRPDDVLARWTATRTPRIVPIVASHRPERLARVIAAVDPPGTLGRALIDPDATW